MIYLGCHLSSSKGYCNMGREALSIGANTLQFFTRNPRGGKAKAIDEEDAGGFNEMLRKEKFGKLVAHAPYTLNLCSANEKTADFAHLCMEDDLRRMEYIPGNYYNFHPGSHVGQGIEKGIEMISNMLNDILKPGQTTIVLLETMSGKGSEVGSRFEEIKAIIDNVKLKDKIGVCLDTCHVNDAGYNIAGDTESVLEEFDHIIGLNRLKALHINDSMNPLSSHKDRHAKIGEGTLGLGAIAKIVGHPKLQGLPCILETPNELEGYAKEISMIRDGLKND